MDHREKSRFSGDFRWFWRRPTGAGIEWSKAALRPYVETVIDAFGPSRVMFATNWPVLEVNGTYGAWVRIFAEILDDMRIGAADRAAMLGGTARRVYRLPPA